MRVTQRDAIHSISPAEASQQKPQTWRHPGGKLVELGSHSLKQAELLAILIGSGIKGRPAIDIANAILDEYVGLYEIHRRATVDDLSRIHGLGRRKATRILASVEIGRRLHRITKAQQEVTPKTNDDLFGVLQPAPKPAPPPKGPSDADMLAEIIGSGIRGRPPQVIAEDLLARFGSLRGLFGQDMGDFLNIKGLNSVKIIRITAALEIAKRVSQAIS